MSIEASSFMLVMAEYVKVGIQLWAGDAKTNKVWRFDHYDIPSYTVDTATKEILELFPEVKKKPSVSLSLSLSLIVTRL